MSGQQNKQRSPISTTSKWSFELIQEYATEITLFKAPGVTEQFALDSYPNQIVVIRSNNCINGLLPHGACYDNECK